MGELKYVPGPYRRELPVRPKSIERLPLDAKGYPVPWFVAWVDGVPEFRVADGRKVVVAVKENRCWICGEKTNNRVAFVVGPMCTVNRISAEPPSHPECADYAARACPFLTRPRAGRRDANLPEGIEDMPGVAIKRNPGVTCVWTARSPGYTIVPQDGGVLFQMYPALRVDWYCEGRPATRGEVLDSIESGIPILRAADTPKSQAERNEIDVMLGMMVGEAMKLVPS